MHHGTCVTHVPWCMSGSLVPDGGENVPGIPGACAPAIFSYLARGPSPCCCPNKHWGRDKMAAILQTTFSNLFHSVVIVVFWLMFHWWHLFPQIKNMPIYYMKTLATEAVISGRDKWLHPTEYCGMQLQIPVWDTCFWHRSPHIWLDTEQVYLNQC